MVKLGNERGTIVTFCEAVSEQPFELVATNIIIKAVADFVEALLEKLYLKSVVELINTPSMNQLYVTGSTET